LKTLTVLSLLFTQLAVAQVSQLQAPVDHLYVPPGFDDNDAVEVIVAGHFTDTCHSRNAVSATVVDRVIDVQILAHTVKKANSDCIQMVVPFKEDVAIGTLAEGDYEVRVNGKLSKTLTVHSASSNIVDDYLYAAIDNVIPQENGEILLTGWRYSSCVETSTAHVVSNGEDIVTILPTLKQISDFCPMKGMPVSYRTKVDLSSLKYDKALIYVRTMDGRSESTIVDRK
jgi:hypothetical protein